MALVLSDTQFIVLELAKESENSVFAGIAAFSFPLAGPSTYAFTSIHSVFFLVTKKEK